MWVELLKGAALFLALALAFVGGYWSHAEVLVRRERREHRRREQRHTARIHAEVAAELAQRRVPAGAD